MPRQPWIDVHAHFALPKDADQLEREWLGMRAQNFLAPTPHAWTPEGAVAAMDANGIAMQLLSTVPQSVEVLRQTNDFGASIVAQDPQRFGLLAAIPTGSSEMALAEIARAEDRLGADGFAMSTTYAGVSLGNPQLDPVWSELDARGAVVFVHPDTTIPSRLGQATPLIEVTFETARVVTEMLFANVFGRFPGIRFVLAHCGGALPALSGRIALLGDAPWMANGLGLTGEDLRCQMKQLYVDTAASGTDASLAAALQMVPVEQIVYGGDSGVPCTDDELIAANLDALRSSTVLRAGDLLGIGGRALTLFPQLSERLDS